MPKTHIGTPLRTTYGTGTRVSEQSTNSTELRGCRQNVRLCHAY